MAACCPDGTCNMHPRTFAQLMKELGATEIIEGEHSIVATNGEFGGWLKTSDSSYVSIEYAKSINRAQRRKEGIKLHELRTS